MNSSVIFQQIKSIFKRNETKHFISYYIFTILSALVSIYTISYLTKALDPESYGMIGIFLGIVFFVPALLSFSANNLQAINVVDFKEDEYKTFRNEFISFIICLLGLYLIIGAGVYLLLPDYGFVIITSLVYGWLQLMSSIHSTELIQHSRPVQFGIVNFLSIFLAFLISLLFIAVFKLDWKGRIIAMILSESIIVILRFWVFSNIGREFKFLFNPGTVKGFILYGWPLMMSVVAGWIINQSDRFILLQFYSLKEVGIYAAASGISSVITTFNQTMLKVVSPLVYRNLSKRTGRSFIIKLNMLYAIVILSLSTIGSVFIKYAWPYILGASYEPSLPIIYLLCFAQSFFGIYMTLGIVVDYFKQNKLKTMIIWICAVVSIITTLLLIPVLGMYAPAVGTLLSFFTLSVITYFNGIRILNENNVT
ncbi:oligosaccharide flippase family protein [Chitinophaga sp. YIM B06452]|uniref:lipopolysaccharide biosynthesis protein n=1 Tax=Chitinophaga sp. YIM B06452 TaxID=3082158 RepID=UPI0031FF3C65